MNPGSGGGRREMEKEGMKVKEEDNRGHLCGVQ